MPSGLPVQRKAWVIGYLIGTKYAGVNWKSTNETIYVIVCHKANASSRDVFSQNRSGAQDTQQKQVIRTPKSIRKSLPKIYVGKIMISSREARTCRPITVANASAANPVSAKS